MTTDVTYAARYYAKWAPYQSSLDQVIRDNLTERNWALPCDTAGDIVSTEVCFALECFYPDDARRGEVFLLRAIDFADRLIAEKRYLDTDIAELAHPRELADILRFRAYAHWLLGEPLDRKVLKQAAAYYAEWCTTKAVDHKRFAEPGITMDYYLGAGRWSSRQSRREPRCTSGSRMMRFLAVARGGFGMPNAAESARFESGE